MISQTVVSFSNEFAFFNENFSICNDSLVFSDYMYLFFLNDYSSYTFIKFYLNSNLNSQSLLAFINQIDDSNLFENLENITSTYHYSVPNVKLSYPEPFIASPSFIHTDLWFVHILVYQYWLWFFFIFIIVFFFITFLCTLRWCNMRVRPRRETRGVSRSKCGDLITAIVPVTWAISIIVNESTDAIDYYDGFGTTELVVGIRAYQWGWEYYYPKDIDLNYNIKPSYSSFIGNSLKYNKASDNTLRSNNLWKYYQNKANDQVITPAHILALPLDNYKLLNFFNFNDIGASSVQEVNAFKKIRMFSKTYSTSLSFLPNNFSNKYKALSNFFSNDLSFTDSYLYGSKRQHNFLSSSAILNNQSTFLNYNSLNKFINFNIKNKSSLFSNSQPFQSLLHFQKPQNNSSNYNAIRVENLLNPLSPKSSLNFFNNSSLYPSHLSALNDNSDKAKSKLPIYKLFNLKFKKNNFFNFNNANQINELTDLSLVEKNNELSQFFKTNQLSYKNLSLFSSNQSTLISDRFVRHFSKTSHSIPNYNYSLNLNSLNDYLNSSRGGLSNFTLNSFFNSKWSSPLSSNKYLSSRFNMQYPYSPISSNNVNITNMEYDNLSKTFIPKLPNVLYEKEELIPTNLSNIYWNVFFSQSSVDLKFSTVPNYYNIQKSFYLPMFSFYYDYDFRNWQSIELLEDSFWESIYSVYAHDEYLELAKDFYDYSYFDKFANSYRTSDKKISIKNKTLSKPLIKDTNSSGEFYSNSFYIDDFVSPANLILTKDFFIFTNFLSNNAIDDSYESIKFLNYNYNLNNKMFLNLNHNFFSPYSYVSIFNSFRSDYDDFSWFFDSEKTNPSGLDFKKFNKLSFNFLSDSFDKFLNLNNELSTDLTSRFSNSINLRSTVKNSMVTYNAIQKTFRLRFDEGRSNAKLSSFSTFYLKQPFLTSSRLSYEKLLGKSKESFFNVNLYKNSLQPYFNNYYALSSSLNYYFFDFPFLLAMKSDSSRYLWFDWYAKWGLCEVQPSSSARYAIYGMPYFSKPFEFNTRDNSNLNESETYLLRLSRARRNYLPNWVYTPYFYIRNSSWYKTNLLFNSINDQTNSLNTTFLFLNLMNWFWENIYFINYHSLIYSPSSSGINSFTKLNWKPQNSIQSYHYNVSNLIDILTKREYLYRELFSNNNKIINLPLSLTNSPSNPLINEIKSSFLFIDPINLNNEFSRDVYYNSLNFFHFTVIKSYLSSYSSFLNLTALNDFLFFYFFNEKSTNLLKNNSELYKNQYRPMRKGITNMIRLHSTGAIAMPIEIRLQILASSKDVIHSWAIPSAGIKIDCVPGYSSHRVMIFLVSGIFWGQCMEICGRYHHWMPIVVYFMKRDLFFLWCTHFVFLSGSNNMWNINNRQYTDYVKTVSFDKNSWLSEINK